MENEIIITKDLKFGFEDLMLVVNFETEFTLRDILRASMNSSIPMEVLCQILRCSYLPDYWDEAESKPFDNKGDVEYLELYWWGSKSTYDGERDDGSTWGFHGIGREGEIPDDLREHCDKEEVAKMEAEGYRQGYAVEFTPINNLADYPIRISNKLHITDYDADPKDMTDNDIDLTPSITLMELLYWTFWELSFLGGPEDRDEEAEVLNQRVEDLKSGKLKTVPWEEVKEKLIDKFGVKEDSAFGDIKQSLEEAHEHSKGNLDLKTTKVESKEEE